MREFSEVEKANLGKDGGPAGTIITKYGTEDDAQLGISLSQAPTTDLTKRVAITDLWVHNISGGALTFIIKSSTTGTEFFWFGVADGENFNVCMRDFLRCPDAGENAKLYASGAGDFNYYVNSRHV